MRTGRIRLIKPESFHVPSRLVYKDARSFGILLISRVSTHLCREWNDISAFWVSLSWCQGDCQVPGQA